MRKIFSRAQDMGPSHGLDNYQRAIEPTHWPRFACKRVMAIMLPCRGKFSMRKTDNLLKVSTCLTPSFDFYPSSPSALNRLRVFCNRSYDRLIRSAQRDPKLRYDPHLVQRSGQPLPRQDEFKEDVLRPSTMRKPSAKGQSYLFELPCIHGVRTIAAFIIPSRFEIDTCLLRLLTKSVFTMTHRRSIEKSTILSQQVRS